MAYLDDLRTARDRAARELAELDERRAGGAPVVSGEGEIDHSEYHARLLTRLRDLNAEIDREVGRDIFEESSVART